MILCIAYLIIVTVVKKTVTVTLDFVLVLYIFYEIIIIDIDIAINKYIWILCYIYLIHINHIIYAIKIWRNVTKIIVFVVITIKIGLSESWSVWVCESNGLDSILIVGIASNDAITIRNFAYQQLEEASSLQYSISYKHGYCGVNIGDCVRINYPQAGIINEKAYVVTQKIDCKTGCEVEEKALFTKKLFERK